MRRGRDIGFFCSDFGRGAIAETKEIFPQKDVAIPGAAG